MPICWAFSGANGRAVERLGEISGGIRRDTRRARLASLLCPQNVSVGRAFWSLLGLSSAASGSRAGQRHRTG